MSGVPGTNQRDWDHLPLPLRARCFGTPEKTPRVSDVPSPSCGFLARVWPLLVEITNTASRGSMSMSVVRARHLAALGQVARSVMSASLV